LQAIQRRLGNLAKVSQVADLVWIGANIVEFLEAGAGLCGPGVVAVVEVDASLFLDAFVVRNVLRTRFKRKGLTRVPPSNIYTSRGPPRFWPKLKPQSSRTD
jgi:hypothetical protein